MNLFPLNMTGNRLTHTYECTILKVVLKIIQGAMPPDQSIARPSYHLVHCFTREGNTGVVECALVVVV